MTALRKFLARNCLLWMIGFALLCGCSGGAALSDSDSVTATVQRNGKPIGGALTLEVANTIGSRSKGLMYRKAMAADHGMVFVYGGEAERIFWMKNTYIPLDMLFLNERRVVIGILRDVPTLNEEQRSVHRPSQYIVELNAGTTRARDIREGDVFVFDPLPRVSE